MAHNAPLQLAGTTAAILKLDAAERDQCLANAAQLSESDDIRVRTCQIPVTFSLFMDGTNNNRDRDETEDDRAHSNPARLFNLHPGVDAKGELQRVGYYRVYVPGLGTRFEENAEFKETKEGKAMGKGGQARILFGLLQFFNSVHHAMTGNYLYEKSDIAAKLKEFTEQVEMARDPETLQRYERARPSRDDWLQNLSAQVSKKIADNYQAPIVPPTVPEIVVNVIGFSRGAAEAAAFCHWLHAALKGNGGKLAGISVRLAFVGLFDCVASVGLSDVVRRAMGVQFADGHFAWAAELLKPLPMARKVVHMIAAHEQRMNFPLTRVQSDTLTEIIFPGMHSDVGGGYGVRSQGRSPTDGDLLSQIPLLLMHREARMAGMPLALPDAVPEKPNDFAINPDLLASYNAYMEALQKDYQATFGAAANIEECKHFETLRKHHMRLFYDARRLCLGKLDKQMEHMGVRPDAQAQEDLVSYDQRLNADFQFYAYAKELSIKHPSWLTSTILDAFKTDPDHAGLQPNKLLLTHLTRLDRQDMVHQAHPPGTVSVDPLDKVWMDEVAYPALRGIGAPSGTLHLHLVMKYMHDSLAGFYLAGYTTAEDKAEKLVEILGKDRRHEGLNSHEQGVLKNYREKVEENQELKEPVEKRLGLDQALEAKKLTKAQHEKSAVFSYEDSKKIAASRTFPPVLTDADAPLLNDGTDKTVVGFITDSRREGGGYLFPRAIFLAK